MHKCGLRAKGHGRAVSKSPFAPVAVRGAYIAIDIETPEMRASIGTRTMHQIGTPKRQIAGIKIDMDKLGGVQASRFQRLLRRGDFHDRAGDLDLQITAQMAPRQYAHAAARLIVRIDGKAGLDVTGTKVAISVDRTTKSRILVECEVTLAAGAFPVNLVDDLFDIAAQHGDKAFGEAAVRPRRVEHAVVVRWPLHHADLASVDLVKKIAVTKAGGVGGSLGMHSVDCGADCGDLDRRKQAANHGVALFGQRIGNIHRIPLRTESTNREIARSNRVWQVSALPCQFDGLGKPCADRHVRGMDDAVKPAATLVLLREGVNAPEMFMQARAMTMGFAAGMMVFPGGKVDPHDYELAQSPLVAASGAIDIDDMAARVAAVRESFEEAGVLLTRGPRIGVAEFAAAQPAIAARTLRFGEFLARYNQHIDFDVLVPFTRWVPPAAATHRRYDTRFYLARMPQGAEAGHDGNEATMSCWITAADAITRADRGEAKVIFPTRRNLERLAQFGSIDELLAHAKATPIVTVQPEVRMLDSGPHICIPEGIGYPITTELLTSAVRA